MKSLRWMFVLVVFLAACSGGAATQPPAATPPPVQTQVVTVVPETSAVEGTATAENSTPTAAGPVLTATLPGPIEAPTEAPAAAPVAYIGADGNVWVLDGEGGTARQVTDDASQPSPDSSVAVMYSMPRWSSDGRLLAFSQDVGTPVSDGFDYTFDLLVWDRESETSVVAAPDVDPAGMDWKPGTHLLAYALGVDPAYWTARGQQDTSKARGIQFLDYDTGELGELVPPEQGFHLVLPQWSPDGRFLSFDEVQQMEGRGNTDFYDFEAQQYLSPGKALGIYDWSPDGSQLVYDGMTYIAQGIERISISGPNGENARQLSPDMGTGAYAFSPVFSPDGSQVAYLAVPNGPDSMEHVLVVQPISGGEPRELARFGPAGSLAWFQDGGRLLLTAEPFEPSGTPQPGSTGQRQVVEVSVDDGSVRILATGNEADTP